MCLIQLAFYLVPYMMSLHTSLQAESTYILVTATDTLHLNRFNQEKQGLLVHGSLENGRISGKGFAPLLVQQGYDVFVADLRGRGKSKPRISGKSVFGLTHTLENFPAILTR